MKKFKHFWILLWNAIFRRNKSTIEPNPQARQALSRVVDIPLQKNEWVEAPEVVDTPLSKELLEEIEENDACAVDCSKCITDAELMAAFSASATATRKGIDNTIPEESKPNVRAIHRNVIMPLADATGWEIHYNSGHRSRPLNTTVGGSPTSEHLTLEDRAAGDVRCYDNGRRVPVLTVARKAKELNLPINQSILYGTFNHFSHRRENENRRQILYHSSYTGPRL